MNEQPAFALSAQTEPDASDPTTQLADPALSEGLLQLQKPSIPRAIFWAAIWLYISWLVHKRWLPPMQFDKIAGFDTLFALRFKFYESGWIPFAITLTFFIGLHYLWQIVKKLLFPLSIANSIANQVDRPIIMAARRNDYNALINMLNQQIVTGRLGYYSKRFAKLLHRWERDKDIGAVIALKNEVLESDEEDVALALTAISWVEWALPLWGFLGTVVGIGNAIGSVKDGVNLLFERKTLDPAALGLFGEGFKGMAQAFDTTFQGLLFLIIVGGLHFMLRKSIASSLAQARVEFADFVAKWVGAGGDPPIINVHNLDIQMEVLGEQMNQLQEAMEVNDRRATEFRETLKSTVERVVAESPNLEWVRKVLFVPVVEFSKVWLNLAQHAVKTINTKLGHENWKFTGIEVSASGSHGFVAVIEDQKKPDTQWLFFSDLDAELDNEQKAPNIGEIVQTKLKLRNALPSSNLKKLLVVTQNGQLKFVSAQSSVEEKAVSSGLHVEDALFPAVIGNDGVASGLHVEDVIFPAVIGNENVALIVRRATSGFNIFSFNFASGTEMQRFPDVAGNTSKAIWTFHPASAQILVVIQKERRWHLHSLGFSLASPEPKDTQLSEQPAQPKIVCQPNDESQLPSGINPRQLLALSRDEILIVDKAGFLHYWHRTTRPTPSMLKHVSWHPDPESRLLAGAAGWIAVAAHGHLTMWRIQRGGHLSPYEEKPNGFAIGAINIDSLAVTRDGRFVLAVEEKLISVWEFPRYAVDDLK